MKLLSNKEYRCLREKELKLHQEIEFLEKMISAKEREIREVYDENLNLMEKNKQLIEDVTLHKEVLTVLEQSYREKDKHCRELEENCFWLQGEIERFKKKVKYEQQKLIDYLPSEELYHSNLDIVAVIKDYIDTVSFSYWG